MKTAEERLVQDVEETIGLLRRRAQYLYSALSLENKGLEKPFMEHYRLGRSHAYEMAANLFQKVLDEREG